MLLTTNNGFLTFLSSFDKTQAKYKYGSKKIVFQMQITNNLTRINRKSIIVLIPYIELDKLYEIKTIYEIDAIKQKVIDIYKKEISLNKVLIDIPRGIEVINSIPNQLKKENKKFQYGGIVPGKRAKEYETAINYLVNNQLVYRSYNIKVNSKC